MRRFLLLILLLSILIPSAVAQTKPRVAVMNFDYGTVRDVSSSIFGTDVDSGNGISDMRVEKLVNGGVFSVIERKAPDTILNEQNLSNSDPASGKVIRRVEQSPGEVEITDVDEESAVGKYKGTAPAKVGDRVHN
jgi:curli biogenesis system outer membrane secretion channel CsgG